MLGNAAELRGLSPAGLRLSPAGLMHGRQVGGVDTHGHISLLSIRMKNIR